MKIRYLFVIAGLIGAVACTSPTVTAEPVTITQTTAAPTAAPYSPSFPVETPQPETSLIPAISDVKTEAKACGLIKRAQGLPTYSSRWDSVLYDAEDAAHSDGMYTLVDNALNAIFNVDGFNYDAVAEHILDKAVNRYCGG